MITCVSKLGLVYGAVIFATMLTTARELLHPLVSTRLPCTLLWSDSFKIYRQGADSRIFRASVPLVMEITLSTLVMVNQGDPAAITRLTPRDLNSLGTEASLSPELLVLTLDTIYHVTAQKHLHLCEAILEKLLLSNFNLVAEEVDLL